MLNETESSVDAVATAISYSDFAPGCSHSYFLQLKAVFPAARYKRAEEEVSTAGTLCSTNWRTGKIHCGCWRSIRRQLLQYPRRCDGKFVSLHLRYIGKLLFVFAISIAIVEVPHHIICTEFYFILFLTGISAPFLTDSLAYLHIFLYCWCRWFNWFADCINILARHWPWCGDRVINHCSRCSSTNGRIETRGSICLSLSLSFPPCCIWAISSLVDSKTLEEEMHVEGGCEQSDA